MVPKNNLLQIPINRSCYIKDNWSLDKNLSLIQDFKKRALSINKDGRFFLCFGPGLRVVEMKGI